MLKKKSSEKTDAPYTQQEVKEIIDNITKYYGQGIITTLEESKTKTQNSLSTGSFLLDQAVGGGYAFGRIIEFYGLESSGKTTLALHAVSECQKLGRQTAYIDLENALDIKYAKNIGIKTNELLIVYPKNGEEALDLVVRLIGEGVSLIVVDSVAALIPKAELEADLEKQTIGSQARMMSAGLRKINAALTNKETIIVFINQIRNKISTGFFGGNPETTTGGKALGFFASLRISLRFKDRVEKGGEFVGIKVQAKVTKNKLSSPYKEALLEIIFAQGIQKSREVLDLAVEKEIIQKSGNWYSYQEQKLGNGREAVIDYLINHPQTYSEIEQAIVQEFDNSAD